MNEQQRKGDRAARWIKLGILAYGILLAGILILIGVLQPEPSPITFRVEDGHAVVVGVRRNVTSVTVPDTYMGVPVTEIADYAFLECNRLTEVTLPESISVIGKQAFFHCTAVKTVHMPCAVETVGENALTGCVELQTANVHASVLPLLPKGKLLEVNVVAGTHISEQALNNSPRLQKVTIGEQVTHIGVAAFGNCPILNEINLNATALVQSGRCFFKSGYGGIGIKLSVGANVTHIPSGMFRSDSLHIADQSAPKLTEVVFSASNPCTAIDRFLFFGVKSLTSVTLPAGVTTLGESAFAGCTGLTSITLPAGVTTLGESAFAGCTGLTSITLPAGVTALGESVFAGCTGLTSITLPAGVTTLGESVFAGCTSLASVYIPDGVTEIGRSAFTGCTVLRDIRFPARLTTIGHSAFENCTGLTGLSLTAGLVTLQSNAFAGCTGLTALVLPAGVTTLGASAFAGCTSLATVSIPASLTSISSNAFAGCKSLAVFTVAEDNTRYQSINGCLVETATQTLVRGTKDGVIPQGVTAIGDGAFADFTALTSMTIPDYVLAVSEDAFCGCTALESVTFAVTEGWRRYSPNNPIALSDVHVLYSDVNAKKLKDGAPVAGTYWKRTVSA